MSENFPIHFHSMVREIYSPEQEIHSVRLLYYPVETGVWAPSDLEGALT